MERIKLFIVVLALAYTTCQGSISKLTAHINMNGMTADITFTKGASPNNVMVKSSNRVNFPASVGMTIHEFWVHYDVAAKCQNQNVGKAVSGLSGTLSNSDAPVTLRTELKSLEGKSIVLTIGGKKYCSTIQQEGEYITAHADFQDDITGTVYFRQYNGSQKQTIVLADLRSSKTFYTPHWKIIDSADGCMNRAKLAQKKVFNPTSSAVKVGNLQQKFGQPTIVLPNLDTERKSYVTEDLNLSEESSIIGKYLVIYDENHECTCVACAKIEQFKERKATAMFSHEGVSGSISFKQASPFDETHTDVRLKGLAGKAKGYHVHKYPVPIQTKKDQPLCANDVVAGHFNPYNIGSGFPAPLVGTDDQYEVGDLSSKYGTLAGISGLDEEYKDYNLPLFGTNSILGRSLVIHRNDASNSRWVCSNILPDHFVVAGVAVFKYPVIGHIYFTKNMETSVADTWMFTSLQYMANAADSLNRKWTINDNEVGADMVDDQITSRCASSGSLYDPQNCTAPNCKVGELWRRHGSIDIGGTSPSKYFFTDKHLMLGGMYNILGKSVAIYDAPGTKILACATIMPLHKLDLTATLKGSTVSGSLSFHQEPGYGARPTKISLNLNNFDPKQQTLQILSNPVMGNMCKDLGTVYNPLDFTGSKGSTDNQHKIGDLSSLTGNNAVSVNLPLSGLTSIRSRSVVVSNTAGSVTLACGKIEEPFSKEFPGFQVSATLYFGPPLKGVIYLQQVLYRDGSMSDTTVIVNLMNKDDTKTLNHNWHVHVMPVMLDSYAKTGRCSSTGPHYDPFMAKIGNAASSYTSCDMQNPLRCELGDQAKKLGTYSLGEGIKVYTDVDLPLNGMFRVQGRSIVVHVMKKGAPRYACASIIPEKSISPVTINLKTPSSLDLLNATNFYASAINIKEWEIAVQLISTNSKETELKVHFLGLKRSLNKGKFLAYFGDKNNRGKASDYSPTGDPNRAGIVSASTVLLVVSLVLVFALRQ